VFGLNHAQSGFTATIPRCRSWQRARPTPAEPGSMSATTGPSAGHHHRQSCSTHRATARATTRNGT
jgi:hypothetical protein